ncbi:hypothetical protein KIPB_010429 [Kipferlia bialata]|uniref:Uncharacterized protein n=1 Tax=Kipferlia bialata TaxID=797122 RepID=A0A9K3D5Q1_9EUKA|nr:hypothetical protein KIPB_010429 [Kipferlia bialata]|eukprot:g10429.t1
MSDTTEVVEDIPCELTRIVDEHREDKTSYPQTADVEAIVALLPAGGAVGPEFCRVFGAALTCISRNQDLIQDVIDAGAIPALMQTATLHSGSASVVESLNALINISRTPVGVYNIVTCGVPYVVVSLLSIFRTEQSICVPCLTLICRMCSIKEALAAMMSKRLIQELVEMAEANRNDAEFLLYIFETARTICRTGQKAAKEVTQGGLIEAALRAMADFPDNVKVTAQSLVLLVSVCLFPKLARAVAPRGAEDVALAVLAADRDDATLTSERTEALRLAAILLMVIAAGGRALSPSCALP